MCAYWPEFAAAGKREVTVREVVSHTARLPGVTCGELVRRIDRRSVGRFFAEELAGPLDLDVFIGLPDELESRVSRLELADTWGTCPVFDPEALARDELMRAVWGNPSVWTSRGFPWNERALHAAELPGAGGIGTARSIAKLYGSLEQLISPEVLKLGRTQIERREEPSTRELQSFGVGFELQTEHRLLGPRAEAFGHGGAGGSVHGAWPRHGVGFSYAMNFMRDDELDGDARSLALLTALYDCVVAAGV